MNRQTLCLTEAAPVPLSFPLYLFSSLPFSHSQQPLLTSPHRYLSDVADMRDEWKDGKAHTRNYFKLAQSTDAHSVYHCLDEIHQPTLVVAGM